MPGTPSTDPATAKPPAAAARSDCFAVARQPILDRAGATIGYELLCRPVELAAQAPETATASVILHAIGDLGLPALVGRSRAFVNVTRAFLVGQRPLPLPPRRVVLELLEDQVVDGALLEATREIAAAGFPIALDDFVYDPEMEPLLSLAAYVKLDLREHDDDALERTVARLKPRGLTLIAEKVEEPEEHARCLALGFDGFQGYYYERPETWRGRAVPTAQLATLGALAATDSDVSLRELETIIRRDAGLSHRLLRFANSAEVAPRNTIQSLRQALALLGGTSVRRWALMLCLAGVPDLPHVLLEAARLRARVAEQLAPSIPGASPDRAFIVGLFSLLDAISGQSMEVLLEGLDLHPAIERALLARAGAEGALLEALLAHEHDEPLAEDAPVTGAAIDAAYAEQLRASADRRGF
ncbi:EAL and HDOD domain-containing protein [Conexibacter arvalis]|uniref:EAL and modified HD-GYP domain-containing signal transduction protein n=1 Tax=Conexibacter arvalis TaxID=912552 RepID=A0A840IBW1_9ACTN|nr:HDOD domain-containing protein [Conexibacter arvalis]MBB4662316.1 EAL and modified HD-GYP domain-containing signal transduction protein [Conexibacter arvalis]